MGTELLSSMLGMDPVESRTQVLMEEYDTDYSDDRE